MNLKKHGLKVLGVSLIAALGLMAIGAVGAQAAGEWKIGGKTMSELGLASETYTAKLEPGVNALYLVKTLNIEIKCSTIHVLLGDILPSGIVDLKLTFLGCKVFDDSAKESELTACSIKSAGQATEVIETQQIKGLIILHGGKNYSLTTPSSGLTFTTVELIGASCAPKGSYPIAGTTVVEIGAEAKELLLTPVKEPEALFPEVSGKKDGLKFGENKAFLAGAAVAELTGAKKGSAWTGF